MGDRAGILCRGVSRSYRAATGSVDALESLDLSLEADALTAVVGPSGCGKSSLLRLLAGIDQPDAGTIAVDDIEVGSLHGGALRRFRRETVSYLAQRPAANLIPHLTLREHLNGAAGGIAVAEELGIAHRLNARAGEMSGGEQARAAIAVGIARPTAVVLVDEPTAELDRETARHVIDALVRTSAAGRTVVVATHDPDVIDAAGRTVELAHRTVEEASIERRSREPGSPVILFQRVSKSYDGAKVVDDVTLELHSGELGVLSGRSGSGKSTALMIAGGWLAADSGSVRVPGSSGGPPPWDRTSYLSQRFGLLPELSIAENIALPLQLAGAPSAERVAELLDVLALTDLADRPPAETSVGQQQRAALARALAHTPSALLADEPTSHQDTGSAKRVWSALAAACTSGTACLLATHEERVPFADRRWRIGDGRVEPF